MADNKKYYYMRLKENFFDSSEISLLESMPDGYLYSNILLKLYLRSLRGEGRLAINNIPYSPEMIATVTHHPVETVKKALDIFQKLGLIEILDSGVIYMLNIQEFIGESSTEADRIRAYRQRIAQEKDVQMYDKRTPEIEIEKGIPIHRFTLTSSRRFKPRWMTMEQTRALWTPISAMNTTRACAGILIAASSTLPAPEF